MNFFLLRLFIEIQMIVYHLLQDHMFAVDLLFLSLSIDPCIDGALLFDSFFFLIFRYGLIFKLLVENFKRLLSDQIIFIASLFSGNLLKIALALSLNRARITR